MRQLLLDVRPDTPPRLDNFVAGANGALLDALHAQLDAYDGSVLYLWGPKGSGRSHLLQAAVAACAGRRPAHHLLPSGAVPEEAREALLAIDDVQAHDADAQAALFRALITARERQLAFVVAADVPPHALSLRADVASRLAQGTIFQLQPLDDIALADTLQRHAAARGMQLDDGIVAYLLRHGRRELPWLLAVLDALDEASLAHGRRITLPLLREILKS